MVKEQINSVEGKKAFRGKIVTHREVQEGYLLVEDGKIAEITHIKPDVTIIDCGNAFLLPGYIDLHIHGVHRYLVDNGEEDLKAICKILPQYGVTGFLPTLTPKPKGEDAAFLSRMASTETVGTQVLGFHLEGPFLKITGALDAKATTGSDEERVRSLIEAALPFKAIFSISPDAEGIEKVIPLMASNGTPVFITHTRASVAQTQRAIDFGARHATHFYDVFPIPDVTEPGVRPCGAVEAILADERVGVDFILDGVHVDPVAVKMALLSKRNGPGRVCLITDAMIGSGLGPGRYSFGSISDVIFTGFGTPARSIEDNTLAGSGLTMDQALRNALKWLDIDLSEASKMVSLYPAEELGISNRKGLLQKGYDADFVVLNDNLEVQQTWIGGVCHFDNYDNNK